jgi:hypothetical protein
LSAGGGLCCRIHASASGTGGPVTRGGGVTRAGASAARGSVARGTPPVVCPFELLCNIWGIRDIEEEFEAEGGGFDNAQLM